MSEVYGDHRNRLGTLLLLLAELRRAAHQYAAASKLIAQNHAEYTESQANKHSLALEEVFTNVLDTEKRTQVQW